MTNIKNYEWKKMPFNNWFHNTLINSERKKKLVCLSVGVVYLPFLVKISNLHRTLYSYIEDKAKIFVYIIKNDLRDQYTQTLQASNDTWQESKPTYQ
jgi:hypothetical protein